MSTARKRIPSFVAALALASLAACGGGGGGGGGGGSSSNQSLNLSKNAVSVSQPVTVGTGPEEAIGIALENAQPGSYVRIRATGNGLRGLADARNGLGIDLVLKFKAPFDLRPGVYDDTVLVEVCTDSTCASLVPGVSKTVPVRYTVTAANLRATIAASSVELPALVTDPSFPGVSEIDFTLDGAVFQPFIEVTSTHNAVGNVASLGGFDNRNYKLRYDTEAPASLGPGVYDDTITVSACLDRNCVNPFPPSPLTVRVRLTVTDSVGGPNGYTVRLTNARGVAMAWDATRQRIYLSAPDMTGADKVHNVAVFDPAVAQISATVPMTSRPEALAISDDDGFLYVAPAYVEGHLERLRLADLVADSSMRLIDSRGDACHASDLAVAPSQPAIVAIGCQIHVGGPRSSGVVVFDGLTLRGAVDGAVPHGGVNSDPHYVTWGADASRVFSWNERQNPTLYDISVGAGGLNVVRGASAATLGRLRFAAGLLYADDGSIFDPDTLAPVASLAPRRDGTDGVPLRVIVDMAGNRIFAIARFPDLPSIHFREPTSLVSFDLAQQTQIASIPLDPTLFYSDLLRFGNDGLGLLGESRLILVNGAFVAP